MSYLRATGRPLNFGSGYPKVALFRSVTFFIGFLCFYYSLVSLPIAVAVSLFFVSPFIITILSRIILKNKIGWHRIFAIIFGFSGTLLIVKPGLSSFRWEMLLPLFAACTYSFSMILAKLTQDKDTAFQQTLHIYIGSIFFSAIFSFLLSGSDPSLSESNSMNFLLRSWQFYNPLITMCILAISFTGTIGILCLITAYRIGTPSVISPFEYTMLCGGLATGYIFFGEVLDLYSFLGMTIIVISGCYVFIREGVRKDPVATKISLRT